MKSYLLTFLVGSLLGPVQAGIFFLFLKFSEILSIFGATSSETSIATLSGSGALEKRRASFRAMYSYSLAMCLPAFTGLVCCLPWAMTHWMKAPSVAYLDGIWVGLYGLASGWKRIITIVCTGVELSHSAALWGILEIGLTIPAVFLLYPGFGVAGVFLGCTLSTVALFPPATQLARLLEQSAFGLWIRPALGFLLGSGLVVIAWESRSLWLIAGAILVAAGTSLRYLQKSHRMA
ncbi:MAG: hypothetical protein QM796_22965 [Chthoniobacteraceae bacterium]